MKKILLFFVFVSVLFGSDATMEIVKRLDKLPTIALQDGTSDAFDQVLKRRFFQILVGDFKVSANYNVIDEYYKQDMDDSYRFGGIAKPDFVLRYALSRGANDLSVHVKLFDARSGAVKKESSYKIDDTNKYPFLAHRVVVDSNESMGGEPIEWMQKNIIFAKYISPKVSEIVVADYTLTFQQSVIRGGLNIFPKWANVEQSAFYYSDYTGKLPTIFKFELSTGQKTQITQSQGMAIVSDVSKDGERLLVTLAPNDQPDVYLYNLRTNISQRVTTYSGIDVGANFIDDEKRVVFVSDRLGNPNIFAQTIGQSAVEQLVNHGRNNNSSSAYDKYIVYSSREKSSEFGDGVFNLYLISTQTNFIRQLTATGKNLFPRFSHDGQSIIFIKEYANQSALGIIRLGANKAFHFPLKSGNIQSIDW